MCKTLRRQLYEGLNRLLLYTRYPIVARRARPSASREQRCLAYKGCSDSQKVQPYLRNLDLESASMVVDKLLNGMCEESTKDKSQTCFVNVFELLKRIANMVDITLEKHDSYSYVMTEKQKQRYEENCDMLFGPIKAWDEASRGRMYGFDFIIDSSSWGNLVEKSSAFMENLFCKWPCKSGRGSFYPCCLKRILLYESLYSNLENFIRSLYRIQSTAANWSSRMLQN